MAAGHGSAGEQTAGSLLTRIAGAQRQQRIAFRVQFFLVWVVLIFGLVVLLASGRRGLDAGFIAEWSPFIIGGAGMTILVSAVSIALATIVATLGAFGRLSTNAIVYGVASLYVSLARGTPLLVQIFFAYFALAEIGLVLPGVVAGICALAFNYGAYMTEIFRAGIQAVPRGQREAAEALGMPERLVMRRIVLPQAFRIVVPAIGNEFIAMLKDSALVSTIGITELLWRAQAAGRPRVHVFEAILVAALVYWILTILFSILQDRLERRMARSDR